MPEHAWDVYYQSGTPPWETGRPSSELARVLAEEKIAPCRVLEIGCGSGFNAVWLAQQGFDVTAIDFTPRAIEQARQRAASAGVSVSFAVGDVLNLQQSYEPFPFFFDRGCYHSIRNGGVPAYMQTLQRLTAPGAIGLVLTGNAHEPHPLGQGPPQVTEVDIHAEWEPAFEILRLREFRFDTNETTFPGFLAWSCLLRRAKDI